MNIFPTLLHEFNLNKKSFTLWEWNAGMWSQQISNCGNLKSVSRNLWRHLKCVVSNFIKPIAKRKYLQT